MRHSLHFTAPVIAIVLSCIIFVVTVPTWPLGVRFEFPPLNYWFTGISALAVPVSLAWFSFAASTKSLQAIAAILAALLALPLAPIGLIALHEGSTMTNGVDNSFFPLDKVDLAIGTYRLYQTDCGATCATGLVLRREFSLFGTIKIVMPIWSSYREDSALLRISPSGQVEVIRGGHVLYVHTK